MYFITMFEKLEKNELGWWDLGSKRTVGYFHSLEEAREIVRNNVADLCETIYDFALIEGIDEGLYPVWLNHQELFQVKNPTVIIDGKEVYNNDLTYESIPIPEDFAPTSVVIG